MCGEAKQWRLSALCQGLQLWFIYSLPATTSDHSLMAQAMLLTGIFLIQVTMLSLTFCSLWGTAVMIAQFLLAADPLTGFLSLSRQHRYLSTYVKTSAMVSNTFLLSFNIHFRFSSKRKALFRQQALYFLSENVESKRVPVYGINVANNGSLKADCNITIIIKDLFDM